MQHLVVIAGNLRCDHPEDGVTFVLGAGVGIDAGLPSWNGLLSQLLLDALQSKIERKTGLPFPLKEDCDLQPLLEVFDKALDETSPLVLGRFAQFEFEDNKENEKSKSGEFVRRIAQILVKPADRPSKLMQVLVAWLDAGLSREVMTYNLDRLLEEALEKKSWKDVPPLQGLVRTFKKPGAEGVSVRILHVHGVLHPQGTGGEGIVFSEPDYHRQYGNPYSWSNLAQLNAFTRERCLFVGVSLTDPNMRRLLEAARIARRPTEDNTAADTPAETPYGPKDTKPHFVFLKQTSVKEVRQRLGVAGTAEQQIPGQPPELDETIDLICKLADAARDAALEALGVQVIWSSTFDETIKFLDEICTRLGTQAAGETR